MQQWTTKQNRDATRARVGINFGKVCRFDPSGVERQLTRSSVGDADGVGFKKSPHHGDVANNRNVGEDTGFVGEQCRDHGFGDKVFRPAHTHFADEGFAAVNGDHIGLFG